MKKFLATKVSGAEGTLFASSVLPYVVAELNKHGKYKSPFYGLSFNFDKSSFEEWIRVEGYEAVCNQILDDIRSGGLEEFRRIKDQLLIETSEFAQDGRRIISDMDTWDKTQLLSQFKEFMKRYIHLYSIGSVTFLYESIISDKLVKSLGERYQNAGDLALRLLGSDYNSFMIESEELLHRINTLGEEARENLITKYMAEFYYIESNYKQAPILTRAGVLMAAAESHPTNNTQDIPEAKLNEYEQGIIELFILTEPIRDQRKRGNMIGNYVMFRFLEQMELLFGVEKDILSKATFQEISDNLEANENFVEELKGRKEYSIVYDGGLLQQGSEVELHEQHATGQNNIKEFKGMVASTGDIKGPVKLVLGTGDFSKVQDGDIIVSKMTRPEYMPVLKVASAFITDEGGLTCHAAIVAREMHKPCIIGTKIATQILHDGDIVEVDTEHGIVKIIK